MMKKLANGLFGLVVSSLIFAGGFSSVALAATTTNTTSTTPATTTTTTSTSTTNTSSGSTATGIVAVPLTQADATNVQNVLKQVATELGYTGQAYVSVIPNPKKVSTNGTSSPPTKLLSMGGNNEFQFNVVAWQDATSSSQDRALTDFVRALQKSPVSQQGQQNIVNTMESQDNSIQQMLIPILMSGTSANIYGAMRIIGPALPLISIIFGVGAFVIMLFLMMSTVMDLCFIGLPIFRDNMINRTEQRGGSKVPFVSHDAVSCVKETELDVNSSGGYKNVYLLYLRRRIVTYIILSICILYLVVGELGGVVAWLLHLVSGTTLSGSGSGL